jgi:UDP-N-acetylglucosamine 2-epimerase (non-hydrolysing)
MLTVLSIFGTRPEAIKMAPVVRALARRGGSVRSLVCVTAQHRQMLDQVLDVFAIRPDADLDVMRPDQGLSQLTASVIEKLDPVVKSMRPDWILVQGDTTTVMAASLVAFYNRVRVGHVEAGLRTFDKHNPFPEEINRRVTDVVTDLCFAPTEGSRQNLLREGVPDAAIRVTGNTVIDALLEIQSRDYAWQDGPLAAVPRDRRLVLITAHRRETFGAKLLDLLAAIRQLADRHAGDCHFVYPVHPNPNVRGPVHEALGGHPNVTLLEPLDYVPLVHLMKHSTLILTDSGGIQEEAPALGVPVLVLRDVTERPEGVAAGTARLVGTDTARVVGEASRLLDDAAAHATMAKAVNPYGDGHAAERIVDALAGVDAGDAASARIGATGH